MSAMPGLKGMIRTIGRREFREFIESAYARIHDAHKLDPVGVRGK